MKKLLVLFLLFSFTFLNAQITFEKGYFINNSGKKTECYIENLDWRSNPTSFTYKMNATDTESKIENIAGVSEFGIDNESMHKRFSVEIERSQVVTSFLQSGKNPVMKLETLFLHALVTGEANLYSYVDGNITKYFFETKTTPIQQLIFIRYLDGQSENVQQNNQYKQQLLNSVKCGNMTDNDFRNLEYNKNSLVRHFLAYNSCNGNKTGTDYNAATEGKRNFFDFLITAGAYMASASVTDPDHYYDMNTDLKKTIFKVGLEAEFILPFNKGSWSIFTNPSYEKFDPAESFTSLTNNPGFANDKQPVHLTVKMDYSSIEIPIGVRRYFFINPSSKIFANLMYVIDLSSSGNIVFTNSDGLTNANEFIPLSSKNNLAVGLGYTYKSFSGEIRYNLPRQLSSYLLWNVKYSTVGLNVGYRVF